VIGRDWELPGQRRFIEEIRDHLERGDQLTIAVPARTDTRRLAECVRRATPALAFTVLSAARLCTGTAEPVEALLTALHIAVEPGAVPSIQHLFVAPELAGLVVSVDGVHEINEDARTRWGTFLAEYADVSRRLSSAATVPGQIVLVVNGDPAGVDASAPGWTPLYWWGRLDRLDVGVFVHRTRPSLDRVVQSCVVEIAGFDLALAETLAYEHADDPERTVRVLTQHKHELLHAWSEPRVRQTWCSADAPGSLTDSWACGQVDRFDGENRAYWHSCMFVDEARTTTIRRRIWVGQVRSILPRPEEWRVLVIEEAKAAGFIASGINIDELEFAALHDQLRKGQRDPARARLAEFAGWLRHTRNRISHLDLVDERTRRDGDSLAIAALRGS